MDTTEDKIETKKTGSFLPKKKFLGFITSLKSGIRLLSDKATIDGKQLSGMLDDINFEMTLYPDGTIDFIEIGTNSTTPEMIQRLIDDISDRDVTGYTGKFVIHGLTFKVIKNKDAENKTIKISDNTNCYLEVEHERPIDKLFSLMDDKPTEPESNKVVESSKPSEKAMSILDSLFEDESVEFVHDSSSEEVKEPNETPVVINNVSESYLAESFRIMNEEKITELKSRIEKGEKEIHRTRFELQTAENKLKKITEDVGVLNTRLETLTPPDDPNGWLFFVSEEKKTGIEVDDNIKEAVEKISPLLGLIPDKILKFLVEGHFIINIGVKDDIEKKDFKLPSDILQKIFKIGVNGKIKMISESEFEYRGELNWHQLVSKMTRMGFEQSPEFEKLCGSNSYTSDFNSLPTHENTDTPKKENNQDMKNELKVLASFDKPTDIVILGLGDDMEGDVYGEDFKITDDESGFNLYVDKKMKMSIGSMGFGSVLTVDEYQKFLDFAKKNPSQSTPYLEWSDDELISGVVVMGFVGNVEIAGLTYDGELRSDFNIGDYILHQSDDFAEVVVNIPSGFSIFQLEKDLSLPKAVTRNIKIDKFDEFEPTNEDLMGDLDNIESGFVSHSESEVDPKDLIFGIYYTKSKNNEEKIAAYITPRKDFESAIGNRGSEGNGFGYPTYALSSYMEGVGTVGLDISGLEEIQEGVYIPEGSLFSETNVGLNLEQIVKLVTESGIKFHRIFQNSVSQEAKNNQTWTFHSSYEICEILDKIGYDYNDNKFYFVLDIDRDVEKYWNTEDARFDLMVSLDPDDFETSDPDWDLIKDDILSLGLVPEYDGFSLECTVLFDKVDQPENIKNMDWPSLKRMIISGLKSKGWIYSNN
jgi:hypothetical protein